MEFDLVRVAEHVHGHLGWLAAAALAHPAILLRQRKRKAHLSVGLATLFVTVTGGLGIWVYGPYRDRIKQAIFLEAPAVGFLFERKEHLAFGAVVLAWAGAAAYAMAFRAGGPMQESMRTFAYRAFVASALLTVVVAILGTAVASFRSF
jgi:hypothetical protein